MILEHVKSNVSGDTAVIHRENRGHDGDNHLSGNRIEKRIRHDRSHRLQNLFVPVDTGQIGGPRLSGLHQIRVVADSGQPYGLHSVRNHGVVGPLQQRNRRLFPRCPGNLLRGRRLFQQPAKLFIIA